MKKFAKLLEECESDLRTGQAQRIEARLGSLKINVMPREALLPLAHVARRAGLFLEGLKLLNAVIRPEKAPSPQELAEYAVLLQKIGAMEEACAILEQVDSNRVPVVQLYQAFHHFHNWDGPAAIPHLEGYLAEDLTPYDRAIGQVNMAAALLISEKFEQGEALLREYAKTTQANGYVRLEGNCHEMLAQISIDQKDYVRATTELDIAARLFGNEATPDAFFVRKWRSILLGLKSQSAGPILALRAEALDLHEWETVREADLFLVKTAPDQRRFNRLYFGTPFAAYRQRVLRKLAYDPVPPESVFIYDGNSDFATHDPLLQFDIETGCFQGQSGGPVLEPGSKPHQLLAVLLRDLYRPLRVAGLFASLFPDERFDPFTASDRIHRLISRARKALEMAGLPVEITHKNEGFFVNITGQVGLRLGLDREPVDRNRVMLEKLRLAFNTTEFSSRDGSKALALSASAFKRLAAWAIDMGMMEKFGAGSATLYQIKSARLAEKR